MQPTITLLVVEDEELIRDTVQVTLEEGGFALTLAKNGDEAIAILKEEPSVLRGIVTDIDLGAGPNGWEVARFARSINPNMAIVYVSGAQPHEWAANGVPNSTMVPKPFAPAQIVTAISALLNTTESL